MGNSHKETRGEPQQGLEDGLEHATTEVDAGSEQRGRVREALESNTARAAVDQALAKARASSLYSDYFSLVEALGQAIRADADVADVVNQIPTLFADMVVSDIKNETKLLKADSRKYTEKLVNLLKKARETQVNVPDEIMGDVKELLPTLMNTRFDLVASEPSFFYKALTDLLKEAKELSIDTTEATNRMQTVLSDLIEKEFSTKDSGADDVEVATGAEVVAGITDIRIYENYIDLIKNAKEAGVEISDAANRMHTLLSELIQKELRGEIQHGKGISKGFYSEQLFWLLEKAEAADIDTTAIKSEMGEIYKAALQNSLGILPSQLNAHNYRQLLKLTEEAEGVGVDTSDVKRKMWDLLPQLLEETWNQTKEHLNILAYEDLLWLLEKAEEAPADIDTSDIKSEMPGVHHSVLEKQLSELRPFRTDYNYLAKKISKAQDAGVNVSDLLVQMQKWESSRSINTMFI